jgi:hypothetical protein
MGKSIIQLSALENIAKFEDSILIQRGFDTVFQKNNNNQRAGSEALIQEEPPQ